MSKAKIDITKILESLGIGKDEAVAKAIGQLTDAEKIEFITYLYPIEDDQISLMLTIADRYNYTWLKEWTMNKLKLRTSLMGWRSNQLTSIATEKRKEEAARRFLGFFRREKKPKGTEVESFE